MSNRIVLDASPGGTTQEPTACHPLSGSNTVVCEGGALGALTRAARNISRRKMGAFLEVIALGFSIAMMISVPADKVANRAQGCV